MLYTEIYIVSVIAQVLSSGLFIKCKYLHIIFNLLIKKKFHKIMTAPPADKDVQ